MKTLYIMRHGQTLFNLQHKIQGWCDSPLTPPLPYGDFFAGYGGEKEHEFHERICQTIQQLAEIPNDQQILIVTHGAALAQFYRHWEHCAKVTKKSRFYNCCILKYIYVDDKFIFVDIFNEDLQEL